MKRAGRRVFGALLLAASAACVSPPAWMRPGTSRAEVLAGQGRPTAIHALPDGERLQYSSLPAGVQVWNFDFDREGRLVRVQQVLDPTVLEGIRPDAWTSEDLLRLLGRPTLVERIASFEGELWTYRFQDVWGFRRLHAYVDRDGRVRRTLMSDDRALFREAR